MHAIRLVQDTTTTTTSSGSAGAALAVFFVVFVGIYVLTAFAFYGIFKKTGQPTWAAFVPVANQWFLFEAAGRPGWWVLLGLIPCVGPFIAIVLWIIVCIDLANSFGKSGGFAVGLILLSIIFLYILGYGSAQYQGPAAKREPGLPGYPPPPAMPPPPAQ